MLEMTAPFSSTTFQPDAIVRDGSSQIDEMIWIPGGTFRMGSDKHYPEEAPTHRVAVDGFWMDRHPVTNRQFREFVAATGHVTFAEIPPDPKDYPGFLPHMIYAGSLMFSPPKQAVSLRDFSQWWTFAKGADWRHPYGPKSNIRRSRRSSRRPCRIHRRARLRKMGRQGNADRGGMGVCGARRPRGHRVRVGQ